VNVAVTDLAPSIVTTQLPVPLHPAPLQPVKVEVPSGAAVRVTSVPVSNDVEQVAPQSIPTGDEVTAPPPVPVFVRVRAYCIFVNVAVTDLAASIVTTQLPVPLHPDPLQPVKVDVPSGAAVRVTPVPLSNDAEQIPPHRIPDGLEVTLPPPVPLFVTLRAY
jgi:hypothetical protein